MARVLVTRPAAAMERTARKLAERGFEPILLPLFRVRSLPVEDIGFTPAALLLTSANAVPALAAVADRTVPVHVVGESTARKVRQAGFEIVRTGPGTAAELAARVQADIRAGTLTPSRSHPLLYLAGAARKPDLEATLSGCSIPLEVRETYEMEEISYSTDFLISEKLSPPPDAVLLYSANAASRFCALFAGIALSERLKDTRFACLSEDVAQALSAPFRARAVFASEPNETALLETLAAMR